MPRCQVWITGTILAACTLSLWLWHRPAPATQPVPEPAPANNTQAATPRGEIDPVLDLFNPSADMSAAQRSRSELTQQMEQVLTVNFLLRKCNIVTQQEYTDTYRAMTYYLYRSGVSASLGDAGDELTSINNAATASYSLIYSRTPCDSAQLSNLAAQIANWRTAIMAH
jgi:hypothetical protein